MVVQELRSLTHTHVGDLAIVEIGRMNRDKRFSPFPQIKVNFLK